MNRLSMRNQRGGVIIMTLLVLAICMAVFGLVWYAFNGGARARVETKLSPTTTPRPY